MPPTVRRLRAAAVSVASKGPTLVDRALMSRRSPVYWIGWLAADLTVGAALWIAGKRINR